MLYYLSLGSNLGNRESCLDEAVKRIEKEIGPLVKRSSLYYSAPVGFDSPNEFCNLCISVRSEHRPMRVLITTQRIERELGRINKSTTGADGQTKHYDRTIDIDLLQAFDSDGEICMHTPNLTLPHPKMHERDFVMVPLREINHVLLHSCCAPCSSAVLEWMQDHAMTPVIFYSNSNIYPEQEYEIRKNEIVKYAAKLGIRLIEDPYDHTAWQQAVMGLEDEPERGLRCKRCFEFRLERAARKAAELNIRLYTTTLAGSRWKRQDQIDAAGERAQMIVNHENHPEEVEYWAMNWRKGGLQDRRNALLKQEGFYNQIYCGCEYSIRKDTHDEQRD